MCNCSQDLEALESRTGECRIRLQLAFKRDLHPFFPAAVQVQQPTAPQSTVIAGTRVHVRSFGDVVRRDSGTCAVAPRDSGRPC